MIVISRCPLPLRRLDMHPKAQKTPYSISKNNALVYFTYNSINAQPETKKSRERTEKCCISNNLSFQVNDHISNGAILRKPDAVNNNLLLCSMVECNFKGFKELQFRQWNIQYFVIQDVRCLIIVDEHFQ